METTVSPREKPFELPLFLEQSLGFYGVFWQQPWIFMVFMVFLLKYRPLYILAQDSRWSEQRSWKTSGAGGLLDIICESCRGDAAPVAGFLVKCAR